MCLSDVSGRNYAVSCILHLAGVCAGLLVPKGNWRTTLAPVVHALLEVACYIDVLTMELCDWCHYWRARLRAAPDGTGPLGERCRHACI
jgi:hypothetical protein